ncbi:hypothetical protein BHQ17_27660 [Mycolicibacterium holsaticum]|uniref:Uncharacterized protein n=1 Tax=Mycolicibacterium holsaticum TaxID=152142 RepID=A0A1E3R4Q9_9MYCO|nr:hypothetical protein BHQ17_27660 [Mycolicibacterium holsaticum]
MFGLLMLVAFPEVVLPVLALGAALVLYERSQTRRAAIAARADAQHAALVALQSEMPAWPRQPARPSVPSRAQRVQTPPIVRCDARTAPLRRVGR